MIGLALSGGGVRGSYEVGAYFAFKDCHIVFDGYVGTSIGSFNAAFLAAGRDTELLRFWQNVDVAKLLNFNPEYINYLKQTNKSSNMLEHLLFNAKDVIKNKGVNSKGLIKRLKELDLEKDIRKSKKDFGLVTVKAKGFKPIYIFKEDIPLGKINDYILASCNFPLFKQEKIIDNNYYLDGGVYDNMPVNMLLAKGYKKVYVIDITEFCFKRKIADLNKVVIIKPSHNLKSIFNTNQEDIIYNLKLGYYDTIKVIKNLDGKKYIFQKIPSFIYKLLIQNVNNSLLKKMKIRFRENNSKKLILKVIEHIMVIKDYEYIKIYNPLKVIKELKKEEQHLDVWEFIKQLRLF